MPELLAMVGAGIGMVGGPAQAAGLSAVPSSQSGLAAGIMSTMRYVGGMAGIAVISTVLIADEPVGIMQQSKLCFGIYIGTYVFAFLLALGIRKE